jgi:hypothetical protein
MAYIDAANYNKTKSMRGFPIGTIIPFSGTPDILPKGWIPCTGTSVNITQYPLLYECIGNTYGGTAGSTFSLPSLNNRAIVDIFQGHYQFLRSTSTTYPSGSNNHPMGGLNVGAWCPNLNSTQSADSYWSQIGGGTSTPGSGGDSGSVNNTSPPPSTMDLVGVRSTIGSGLTSSVTGISLLPGTYSTSYNVLDRKLGDGHWAEHGHPVESDGSIGHRQAGGQQDCERRWRGSCQGSLTCINGDFAVGYAQWTATNQHYKCGGGQTSSTQEGDGDGCSGGDMLSSIGGVKKFQTSLNQPLRSFANIIGHNHGSTQVSFDSRLVAQSNFTIDTITVNDVQIDNTAGRNAATINMISTTPSLAMMFIIRAF